MPLAEQESEPLTPMSLVLHLVAQQRLQPTLLNLTISASVSSSHSLGVNPPNTPQHGLPAILGTVSGASSLGMLPGVPNPALPHVELQAPL